MADRGRRAMPVDNRITYDRCVSHAMRDTSPSPDIASSSEEWRSVGTCLHLRAGLIARTGTRLRHDHVVMLVGVV